MVQVTERRADMSCDLLDGEVSSQTTTRQSQTCREDERQSVKRVWSVSLTVIKAANDILCPIISIYLCFLANYSAHWTSVETDQSTACDTSSYQSLYYGCACSTSCHWSERSLDSDSLTSFNP